MPAMYHVALFVLWSLLAILQLVDAGDARGCSRAANVSSLADSIPASALPCPNGLELKYLLLGVGTQNYTCLGGDESDTPENAGAIAHLYDIGTPLLDNPLASWVIESVSQVAFLASAGGEQWSSSFLPAGFQKSVGRHFFDEEGPVFALDQQGEVPCPQIRVNVLHEASASFPSCSDGRVEANIKWLLLGDAEGMSHSGADTVYRVMTAGGSRPATCSGLGPHVVVPYVAQYWMFGSPQHAKCRS